MHASVYFTRGNRYIKYKKSTENKMTSILIANCFDFLNWSLTVTMYNCIRVSMLVLCFYYLLSITDKNMLKDNCRLVS